MVIVLIMCFFVTLTKTIRRIRWSIIDDDDDPFPLHFNVFCTAFWPFFFVFQNTIFYLLLLFGLLAVIVIFESKVGWLGLFQCFALLLLFPKKQNYRSRLNVDKKKRNEITLFLGLFLWWTEKFFCFFSVGNGSSLCLHDEYTFHKKWRVSFGGLQMFYFDFKIQLVVLLKFTKFRSSIWFVYCFFFWLVGWIGSQTYSEGR